MRGAFLVSEDRGLSVEARAALVDLGARAMSDLDAMVQLCDRAGRLFTLYGRVAPGSNGSFAKARSSWAVGPLLRT
jgi:hypothetical protein